MLSYKEFEAEVKELGLEFEKWQHLLAAIPPQYRRRYIDTLKTGWDMPAAFDIVMICTHMADTAYADMLAKRPPTAG